MKTLMKIFVCLFCALIICLGTSNLVVRASQESPTSVRASHILVDTKAEAQTLKNKIDKGESFEALAKKYSKCPSGQNGGDLGYFRRGDMVKEFEDSAFSLPVGEVSQPVKTQFGWHLIKVTDKR